MKKFLIFAAAVSLALLGLRYAVFSLGWYGDLSPDTPVTAAFWTEGDALYYRDASGVAAPFVIRGVELPASTPGQYGSDYAIDEETYLRWFSLMQQMGANTIRIYTIYDDDFYNALYRYNAGRETPLYLLQGIQVSEAANASGSDAYSRAFFDALLQDARCAVDVIHGRRNIVLRQATGSGSYRRDVSPYVLGFIVGNEWSADTIAYTDHTEKHPSAYSGACFRTAEGASRFEVLLARVLDALADYEADKYHSQRLYAFLNTPETDPFAYETVYARQLHKFSVVDAEHILPTQRLAGGYFAAYRLFPFCEDFYSCFSVEQKAALRDMRKGLDTQMAYGGYPQLLSRYHSMPVAIIGYSASSSRGATNEGGPCTEAQQGERLLSAYRDFLRAGCAGACIDSWQDAWDRSCWNTAYAVDGNAARLWHDLQTETQGQGLLAFDPDGQTAGYPDGDRSEWTPADVVLEENGLRLSLRYDARGLSLLIEGDGLTPDTPLYLPINLTPVSGSMRSDSPALSFSRAADFLLVLGGGESRLLVQARYESLRAGFLMETAGEDPYVSCPAADDPRFVPIRMILKNTALVSEDASPAEMDAAKRSPTFETGLLTRGNANPAAQDYHSLADYCYGQGFVEVLLPWQLLNFRNPAAMEIHDDYYVHYGVEGRRIDALYIGIQAGTGSNPIPMAGFSLRGWGEPVRFYERLKDSYWILQEGWGGGDAD